MALKRSADEVSGAPPPKRTATSPGVRDQFRSDLLTTETRTSYKSSYDTSKPYKHGVIPSLIQPSLLRSVRDEITANISFTPKETDIYKIHQSGDLANLDGLDPAALERLPSLVTLRDALYSPVFRDYLSNITGAGKLSGKKTDMAVNVYTPGCHLLCHDDVIGSRRVSYILYLMDPDKPWREEWGGALRLYPTKEQKSKNGETVAVPEPDHSMSIPPAFGQLSFFAVQPGLSYHDVEEVYARRPGEEEVDDGGRLRMAISGWYHIPQEGEDGYEEGAEERQAEKSSLAQLQGKADEFEAPRPQWIDPTERARSEAFAAGNIQDIKSYGDEVELTEEDLEFLIQYLNPRYLTPDTVSSLRESFTEDSSLRLALFVSPKFASELHTQVSRDDERDSSEGSEEWETAGPPHKHRYLYQQAAEVSPMRANEEGSDRPVSELLQVLVPSLAFRKWLSLATGLTLGECNVLARRFRRGRDYSLATSYNDEEPQLEVCLGMTPTEGWGASAEEEELEDRVNGTGEKDGDETAQTRSKATTPSGSQGATKDKSATVDAPIDAAEEPNVGGYEAYLAADDDDDSSSVDAPTNPSSATGAGQRRSGKADPAVYKASEGQDEEDDGVLFNQPASWNTLTVVLRDKGTMRFVKYVSRSAPGDRWDISGAWRVTGSLDEGSEGSDDADEAEAGTEDGTDEASSDSSDT